MADKGSGSKNVQGAPPSQHDIGHDSGGTKVPDPQKIEQGTKPSELRDPGDKADHQQPKK